MDTSTKQSINTQLSEMDLCHVRYQVAKRLQRKAEIVKALEEFSSSSDKLASDPEKVAIAHRQAEEEIYIIDWLEYVESCYDVDVWDEILEGIE